VKKKPYTSEATKADIILDGWARGFEPEQTFDELKTMGFSTPLSEVIHEFAHHEAQFFANAKKFNEAKDHVINFDLTSINPLQPSPTNSPPATKTTKKGKTPQPNVV